MPPKPQTHSTTRYREAGYVLSQLWISPEDIDIFRRAAEIDGRSLTQFFLHHGLTAARKILKNSAK